MKKKNARFLAGALCGTAGLIWSVVTILHVVVNSSVQLVLLNLFCAVVWWLACIMQVLRYKNEK